MSTTARNSPPSRSGRAGDRSLTARAVRVRNACLRHAATRLGMRVPEDAELTALGPDATLTQAVQWLQQEGPAPVTSEVVRTAPPFFLRAGCAAVVTLLGLALSFGRVQ
jgi:hypothetical protein